MPSSNAKALEKAKTIPCDAIIFDLEDAVAPDAKPAARDQAVAAVASGEYGHRELTIRCNGLATPWGADDVAAAGAAHAVRGRDPEGRQHRPSVDAVAAGARRRRRHRTPTIWAMIETPTAIFDVREIAAHPRVAVLVMGTNDLAKEIRAPLVPGRGNLHALPGDRRARGPGGRQGHPRRRLQRRRTTPRASRPSAARACEMGFDGKTLIHPEPGRAGERRVVAVGRRGRVRRAA